MLSIKSLEKNIGKKELKTVKVEIVQINVRKEVKDGKLYKDRGNDKKIFRRRYLEEEEYFTGGIQEEILQLVEKKLNVVFPESYKWFLKRYGSGGGVGTDIMGIEKDETDIERFTVVFATKTFMEKYTSIKKGYIVIEYLGDVAICLDTNRIGNCETSSQS